MEAITENTMPPSVRNVCDYAKKVAGTLRKANFVSGILLGAFAVTVCAYAQDWYHNMETAMGFYMAELLLLSNIILIFGILTEKADFLYATLSINAVLIPAAPILIIVSLLCAGPSFPAGAAIAPCGLVAVILQCAIIYGCLLEVKGISNVTEKSSSHVGDYNTVADHKKTWKKESDAIPAVFSHVQDAKQADSPGV
ncbi:uncharacterized protein [Anabrus simplex]|uniref:uncharacterized protein n=1 Tax=Anabrus simplex TaxID=316456 RepID=UPI0035A2A609